MMAVAASHGVPAVDEFAQLLTDMLERARWKSELMKGTNTVEPPLNKSDLADLCERIDRIFSPAVSPDLKKRNQYAVIETAVRDAFNNLLASSTIESPSFIDLWDLLDVISILSDDEQCDPALLFWLVEELLDSQTVAGCRNIFDYLESRRERITAKHFSQKNLVILRSCNELLRRLSRAEDTAFCGRVFIFLFQSFPLGDKSSVNLRGDYHVENVTAYDALHTEKSGPERMDIDGDALTISVQNGTTTTKKAAEETSIVNKGVTFTDKETPMSADELYPIFWLLQESFNQPKKLFDAAQFVGFKAGLEATMAMFKSVQNEMSGRPTKASDDNKRGSKRKRGQGDDDLANAFNPKYLTSRDLFELEISDLSFRRHILVQVLIVMDFLLSLSAKAREKLAQSLPENTNKSVMYAELVLSEEDTKWALDMKRSIADYLRQGYEGAFFYRMVETVLSRDKNWVRWKVENCPSIARPAVTPEEFVEAKASAKKATTNKRLRPNPLGSLDLKFLSEREGQGGLERLKNSERYQLPSIKSFKSKIGLDDMDIDMARDDESKKVAIESKASKTWRALRVASTTKLAAFDKIDRADKIDDIFQDEVMPDEHATNGDEDVVDSDEVVSPEDRRPVVISGPSGVGKGTLIRMLVEKYAKVFGRKVSHTTRRPREGDVHGRDYFFVSKQDYDVMRDGDEFLEFNNYNGNDYGTSRKVVEGIIGRGMVPIMEMDFHGIQQVKDKNFSARFIFLAPPDLPELERRLRSRGTNSEERIQERLDIAKQELEQAKVDGFHNKTIINDDLDTACKQLEDYIFGNDKEGEEETDTVVLIDTERPEEKAAVNEVEMEDNATPVIQEPIQEAKDVSAEQETSASVVDATGDMNIVGAT